MNRKRKPQQRRRANKKIVRQRRSQRLGIHRLDVKVKRRQGAGVRRRVQLPLVAKIAGIAVVLAICAYVGSNIVGRFLWNNPAYTLEIIEFETDGWLTRPAALETADVSSGVNVLRLDLEEIRDRIVGLPQVKDATIVRVLPDKLGISVKERRPMAWLNCPEQNIFPKVKANGILLDEEGVALPCTQMRAEYVHFPVVSAKGLAAVKPGQEIGSDQLVSALELATVCNETFYDHGLEIVKIELVNDYSLLARFNNHTKVTFKPSDIVRQVDDLRAIFEDSLRKNRLLETVNLLPDRNIPITYARNLPAAPRATPVEQAPDPGGPSTSGTGQEQESRQARRAVRAVRQIPARDARPIDDLTSIMHQP